jgi:cell wall-associated NlpC family hydrolase
MTTTPCPGDFGLTQISGGVGRLIRFGQFLNGDGYENFEHAFIYLGEGQIIEAEPGGARIANLSEYDNSTIDWSTGKIPLTDAERELILYHAHVVQGVPYSFLDYFALSAKRLHLFPLDEALKSRVQSGNHLICSQLVDYVYDLSGIHLFDDGRWEGYVTPGDLYELLASKNA